MRHRKLPSSGVNWLEAIETTLLMCHAAQLPAIEGSLDPKIRSRLAPREKADGAKYDRCFKIVMKALRKNPAAEQALFALDEAVAGLIGDQGELSRAIGIAHGRLIGGKYRTIKETV